MSNLVELRTYKVYTNEESISLLEEMLEMARSGELVEIAIAGVLDDGASTTCNSATNNLQLQIGAIEILKLKLINSALE